LKRHTAANYRCGMKGRRLAAGCAAAIVTLAIAAPVLAHGDHDARPLARQLEAGPYRISVWQVYPDAGTAMTPHLIVMFDGVRTSPQFVAVSVAVNAAAMAVSPSTTTANGWETAEGVDAWDVVSITISEGARSWGLDPVVVPPAPTSMLPMRELIAAAILLTAAAALWMLRRTARAWKTPRRTR
jgi:hypothetical protein